MSLEFVQREQEGIEIVDLKGSLTFGQDDLSFRSELDRLARTGKNHVILNLNDVDDIDTTGLGTLAFAVAKVRKAGGNLALVNLKPKHIEILVEAKLGRVFEVFENDQEAINSFFPDRDFQRYDILEFVRRLHGSAKQSPGA
jgi:anti-sigma B factor antagonist